MSPETVNKVLSPNSSGVRFRTEGKTPSSFRRWPLWLAVVITAGLFMGAAVGVGPGFLQKCLKSLLTPVGVTWLGLAGGALLAFCNRQPWLAIFAAACWGILTVGGNYFVTQLLAYSLEKNFSDLDPFQSEPFDAVIVLGGGTGQKPSGQSQVLASGERVVLAGQLYHAGLARTLIVTGSSLTVSGPGDRHPYDESREILQRLGVPANAIVTLPGWNTAAEMQSLQEWLARDGQRELQRVGVVTSAWHLRRALLLAEQQKLRLEPLPADFRSEDWRWEPSMVIPSAKNLDQTAALLHEYLGAWVL